MRSVVPYARLLPASAAVLLAALWWTPRTAANELHAVQPGETLWSIAFAHNLTTRSVAAANGISPDAGIYAGERIRIPSPESSPGSAPSGAYTVRPGDTLTGVAAASGLDVDRLARANGLAPDDPLLAGTTLQLRGGSGPSRPPAAAPHPTDERVDAAFVQQAALEHGVPPALAAAIAHQESGFNNAVVSASNARGVMQILPGTWQFIQSTLVGAPLQAASAHDNVHAGVVYLGQLLRETGRDERLATAAYYQGLASIRAIGLLPETEAYVNDVMALEQRYGG